MTDKLQQYLDLVSSDWYIASPYLNLLLKFVDHLPAIDRQNLLNQSGLQDYSAKSEYRLLPLCQFESLLSNLNRQIDISHIGLMAGSYAHLNMFNAMGYLLSSSTNVLQMLGYTIRYQKLLTNILEGTVHSEQGQVLFRYCFSPQLFDKYPVVYRRSVE